MPDMAGQNPPESA